MKVFIDTNIFLDLVLKRTYYEEALVILNAIEKEVFECALADISILNIDYIAKKQLKNIREFLTLVNSIAEVVGADNCLISKALQIDNLDLEDNLQYVLALSSGASVIISNDKKFYTESLPVLTSKEFITAYINC